MILKIKKRLLFLYYKLPDCIKNFIFLLSPKGIKRFFYGLLEINKMKRDKDKFYVICPFGIGDIVFAARAIEQKKINKQICFLVRSQHLSLQGVFNNITIIADTERCNCIEEYVVRTSKFETNNYLYAFFKKDIAKNILHKFVSERYRLWLDYCNDVYKINPDSLKNCYRNAKGISSVTLTEKDIVLAPFAHSEENISMSFWEKLARGLSEKGYTVYTNVAPYEKPVPGTAPICVPLNEVCAAFENSAGCIALRCGLCDLLAIESLTKILVIDSSEFWAPIWDVTYFRDKDIVNYLYSSEKEMTELILNQFNERS